MPLLFSYGTLQEPDVQVSTFGRRLHGREDALPGFELTLERIENPLVASATGRTHHANVIRSAEKDSLVRGTVFEVTESEFVAVDAYEEAAAYTRIRAVLASGTEAWVYVGARTAPGAGPHA